MSVPSVHIAKDRLRNLLIADRLMCTPDMSERMTSDIYYTISKYIELKPEAVQIEITHSDIHIKITGENNLKLQFLNLKQRYNLKDYKFTLILLVLAVSVIGVFMVGSANAEYQPRQIMGVGLGLLAMVVISLIDYKWILNFYWLMYVVNIALLLAVIFLGTEANGATRWLDLGFVQFQPSDLTKLITILFFARFLADREEQINKKKTILEAIGLIIPSLLLVYKQPSLSATICIAALFCVIMFMAGLSYKFIGTVLAITIPTIALVIGIVVQPNQPFLKDYQQKRILAWLEPEAYATEEAYQQLNSVMAIGSGQLNGKGYNSDATTSVKNGILFWNRRQTLFCNYW